MTEGVTLVNGQDAVDGSVQIGKQTEKPDVPVEEYQYAPISETKDPDITVILSEQDYSDAELRVRQLTDIQRSIADNGVNYESVVALENIIPGIIMNSFPELGYTDSLSSQSMQITMERIDGAKLGGIAAVIGIIIASIIALFKKFTDKTKVARDKLPDAEDIKKLENTANTKVPEIKQKANDAEQKIKRNAEASRWLIEKGIIDIIQLHGRLCDSLNVDALVKDVPGYLKQISSLRGTQDVYFNIDNVIGGHMPNIFYAKDIESRLRKYVELLNTFPSVIRKRLDSLQSLNVLYASIKNGFDLVYERDETLIINAVSKFTNNHYANEQEAINDLVATIRNDWHVENRQADLTRAHISNIIGRSIKPLVISILDTKEGLEQEFGRLEKFKSKDLKSTMDALANSRAELEKLINATYVTEEKKHEYRRALKKLEAAPDLYQNEYKIMGKLANTAMSPIINVASVSVTMHRRVNMYYDLLDRLESILKRFDKEFGEDVS